ncbi:MAG: hypothetical protein N2037_01165 [Acidimicrobiales bacterium]|nr:hypothetical protein [Acidimicrobiales bacterium]
MEQVAPEEVSFLERLRRRVRPWDGTAGPPRSANGASSLHLVWELGRGAWTACEATLEILVPPAVPKLYFWALQVSFTRRGLGGGGAHLGLQWHPAHPGGTAVNWGGYGPDGRELDGTVSSLPSATGNPNTRDYRWEAGRPYRLRIEPAPGQPLGTAWRGSVTDVETGTTTVVRDLFSRGNRLDGLMVWSEVFADCDDPSVTVRWSGLRASNPGGEAFDVRIVRVNYQRVSEGGCANTTSQLDPRLPGFLQLTNAVRTVAQGSRLEL